MKLGISYNFFDGEEILPHSLKSVREFADYIVVVYQEVSNFFNPISEEALDCINECYHSGLIDELLLFKSSERVLAGLKETKKRNAGLEMCKHNNCTHYLCMDADELYEKDQLAWAIKEIERENVKSSFCLFHNYFKYPTYREIDKRPLIPPKNKWRANQRTGIPFIFKVTKQLKHEFGYYNQVSNFGPLIDPTRMIKPLDLPFKTFTLDELAMHHMSWVRRDLNSKLRNSSALDNPDFRNKVLEAINKFPSWDIGKEMPFAPKKIEVVENKFGIEL